MQKKLRITALVLSFILMFNIVGVAAESIDIPNDNTNINAEASNSKLQTLLEEAEAEKKANADLWSKKKPLEIYSGSFNDLKARKEEQIAEFKARTSSASTLSNEDETGLEKADKGKLGYQSFGGSSAKIANTENGDVSLMSVSSDTYSILTRPSYINNIYAPAIIDNSGEVSVSPFTGDLQINVTDIVLPGKNGLDLNLNHFYQSSHSDVEYGDADEDYKPAATTYYNERYALGLGWSFGFPSVEVRNSSDGSNRELYYHDGTGSTYRYNGDDERTGDAANGYMKYETNLDNYYTDNVVFSPKDRSYSRNGYSSQYSFKTADNTMQYFTETGELLAIVDRFGNEIKFDYENYPGRNLYDFGSMYDFKTSSNHWTQEGGGIAFNSSDEKTSTATSRRIYLDKQYETYRISFMYGAPIETFNRHFSGAFDIKCEIFSGTKSLDTITLAENIVPEEEGKSYLFQKDIEIDYSDYDYEPDNIKISFNVVKGKRTLEIYHLRVSPMRPLISKITDTIGRTLEFDYVGDLYLDYVDDLYLDYEEDNPFPLTVTVKDPGGKTFRTIEYKRKLYTHTFTLHDGDNEYEYEQRFFMFLGSYDGETPISIGYNSDLEGYGRSDGFIYDFVDHGYDFYGRPLVSKVDFYYYETVINYAEARKRIGNGFTDTWRVESTYDIDHYANDDTKHYNTTSYDYTSGYYDDETACNKAQSGISYLNPKYGEYKVKVTNSSGAVHSYWYTTHTFKKGKKVLYQIRLPLLDKEIISESAASSDDSVEVSYTYDEKTLYAINSPNSATTVEKIDGVSRTYINNYEYSDDSCLVEKSTLNLTEKENKSDNFPAAKTRTVEYEEIGNRMFLPKTQSYYQNESGELLSTSVEYDSLGRTVSTIDENGDTIYYEYDETYPWQPSKIYYSDPMKTGDESRIVETLYEYNDSYGFGPTSTFVKYADGQYAQSHAEYEPQFGNIIKATDENGNETEFTYDEFGRLKFVYYPSFEAVDENKWVTELFSYITSMDGRTVAYDVFLSDKKYGTEEDMCVKEIFYEYNGFGNLAYKYDYHEGTEEENVYDLSNRLIGYRNTLDYNSENITVAYSYDNLDRIISAKDKMGNIQKVDYKSLSKEFSFIPSSGGGAENHYTENYDIYGNLIETKTYPDGIDGEPIIQTYEYDLVGNLLSTTDGNQNTVTYEYDNVGNPITAVFPENTVTKTSFAKFGTPISVTRYDGDESYTIAKTYDDRGLETSTEQKGLDIYTRPWYYGYTEDGKLNYVTEPNGNQKSYAYDESGNLTVINADSESRKYTYDYLGCVKSISSIVNGEPSQTVEYTNDRKGNVIGKSIDNRNTSYNYNMIYNLMGYRAPNYETVDYTRDSLQRVTQVNANRDKVFSYTYYDDGMIKDIVYPSGDIVTSYTYDNANQLTSVVTKKGSSVIASYDYTYDNAGNILSVSGSEDITYTYDDLYRLESYTKDGITVSYEYDGRGNIIAETSTDGTEITYEYNGDNRLFKKTENGTVTTYEYDLNGNLISDSNNNRYAYDHNNKLVYANADGTEINYTIGLDGYRSSKTSNGETTTYDVDENGYVIVENDNLVVMGNRALAKKLGDSYYYYIYNGHGDVVMMVDEDGNVVNSYSYDPWGKITEQTETVENSIKYAGEYYDDETGFIYLRARYYDPGVRRFIQEDPARDKWNWYSYCEGNPIKYIDPSGEVAIELAFVAGCTIAGAVISTVVQAAINVATGEKITNDLLAAATGGAVAGLTASTLGAINAAAGLVASSYAGAAVSSAVSEYEHTGTVVPGNLLYNTAVGGTINMVFGACVGVIFTTGSNWAQTHKFTRFFTRTHGQTILKQTSVSTALSALSTLMFNENTGYNTRAIQDFLGLDVDGSYGPLTYDAVKAYQKELIREGYLPEGADDGWWGSQTNDAFVEAAKDNIVFSNVN